VRAPDAPVVSSQLRGGRAELSPLRLERASGLWVEACHGGAALARPLDALRRVDALLQQRAVADRVSNPHGEHAEHTWQARSAAAQRSAAQRSAAQRSF